MTDARLAFGRSDPVAAVAPLTLAFQSAGFDAEALTEIRDGARRVVDSVPADRRAYDFARELFDRVERRIEASRAEDGSSLEAKASVPDEQSPTTSGGRTAESERDPLDLARRRYAAGEISRDEYLQIESDLSPVSALSDGRSKLMKKSIQLRAGTPAAGDLSFRHFQALSSPSAAKEKQ